MLLTLNSLHWENYNQAIVQSQKQVFDKFEIPITYTKANVRHDEWMDYICKNVEADVYFFVDADCVILNREIFDASLDYVLRNNTFLERHKLPTIYIRTRTFSQRRPSL